VSFATVLAELTEQGPALCVGLDPHPDVLDHWQCGDSPEGLARWVHAVIEAIAEAEVALVKPQVALFERHGVSGMASLSQLLGQLRDEGVATVGDAKRGDIGSTMTGYADAWLTPHGDFEVDALTVNPYLGVTDLVPAFELAATGGKGVFVLAATSNPGGQEIQSALTSRGNTVAASVLDDVASYVRTHPGAQGSHGVVIGATVDHGRAGVDLVGHPHLPILSPGFGAQGAQLGKCKEIFATSTHVIAVAARSLLMSGREGFTEAVAGAVRELGP
jgi:orotidine-5'-phosphate decarboxylase